MVANNVFNVVTESAQPHPSAISYLFHGDNPAAGGYAYCVYCYYINEAPLCKTLGVRHVICPRAMHACAVIVTSPALILDPRVVL